MITITPLQKEVIEAFLKHENSPSRFKLMCQDLNITDTAVRIRINGLKKKGLFSGRGKLLTYHDLPFVVIDKRLKDKPRKEKPNTNNSFNKNTQITLTGKEKPQMKYCRDSKKSECMPTILPDNEFLNGKLIKIGIPKYK